MRRRWLAAGLGATLLALALPAGAAAKPGYEVRERALRLELSLPASNGYSVSIETEGHRKVILTARRGSGVAFYRARGRVSRHRIEADFGELGRVSLRFRGERRPLTGPYPPGLAALLKELDLPRRKCHGRKPAREVGEFRGVVEFEGENGFTRVRTRRARGEMKRFYTRVCERSPGSAGKRLGKPSKNLDLRASILYASDLSPRRKVSFEAFGVRFEGPLKALGGFYVTGATVVERKEEMLVIRKAVEIADEGLQVSPPPKSPATANVTLPRPFEGSADYRKERGAPATWEGSLSARLPGVGLVPLAGEEFSAVLCQVALSEIARSPCLRDAGQPIFGELRRAPAIVARPRLLKRLLLTQGSGSQSQFFWDDRLSWSR